ncbi:MAG TPA: hypothetical protein VHN79_12885 [Lacunisphaera sp.]|nr:hypothetical protein [Lacunisphaera sp.]
MTTIPTPSRTPLAFRAGALVCGLAYFPLGLVWAYGFALIALPVALLGFWLLRRADQFEAASGVKRPRAQARLRYAVRWLLGVGLVASATALVLTR